MAFLDLLHLNSKFDQTLTFGFFDFFLILPIGKCFIYHLWLVSSLKSCLHHHSTTFWIKMQSWQNCAFGFIRVQARTAFKSRPKAAIMLVLLQHFTAHSSSKHTSISTYAPTWHFCKLVSKSKIKYSLFMYNNKQQKYWSVQPIWSPTRASLHPPFSTFSKLANMQKGFIKVSLISTWISNHKQTI